MFKPCVRRNITFCLSLYFLVLAVCYGLLADPAPGDVFREYKWNGPWVNARNWQRVTDPNAAHQGAHEFLPNPVNSTGIDDLEDAIKAEMYVEQWGGHAGTSDKKVRINGHVWIPVPESANIGPERPECYQYFKYPVVPIPLNHLRTGSNTFELSCGGQICHDFGWGQWGVYGITFRIYYSPSKPHPTGHILSPKPGSSIENSVTLKATASSPNGSVKQIDFIGFYEDFDYEGNGMYRQWHYTYRFGRIQHHLGTATDAPYTVTWDTSWVPDQAGPMKIMARIVDADSINYMTPEVSGISLVRPGKRVKMYRPYDVPTAWQTRAGRTHRCKVDVDDLAEAKAARMILTTWNGDHAEEIGINNTRIVNKIGKNHDYSYDEIPVPLHLVRRGTNTFYTKSSTEHHGIEVLWPGIVLKVQHDAGR